MRRTKTVRCILDLFHLDVAPEERPRLDAYMYIRSGIVASGREARRSKRGRGKEIAYLNRKRYLHGLRTIEIVTSPRGLYSRRAAPESDRIVPNVLDTGAAFQMDRITTRFTVRVRTEGKKAC